MLYFHNSFQYIVHTKISYLRVKKFPGSVGASPRPPHQGLCPWTPLGVQPQDPIICTLNACYFPQTKGVWIKPCSQTRSSRSSDLWPQDDTRWL